MRRTTRLLFSIALLISSAVAFAQDAPAATPDVIPTVPAATPTPEIAPTIETLPTLPPTTPTPEPPTLGPEQLAAVPILNAARADLELLAFVARGVDRPAGWTGSFDSNEPQFHIFLRLDLELLAGATLGADLRPEDWFGVVPSNPVPIARDIRHDLELLANVIMESDTVRPTGWLGDDPLMRCSRGVQALVTVVTLNGYGVDANPLDTNYCRLVEQRASVFIETLNLRPELVEQALTVPGTGDQGGGNRISTFTAPFEALGPFVVGFYDRKARRRGGVIPDGTQFNVIGRSYTPFSNMMLIEGENFRLFVDYLYTNVSNDEFFALPEVSTNADFNTTCSVEWCEVDR